jgi:predicted esterase
MNPTAAFRLLRHPIRRGLLRAALFTFLFGNVARGDVVVGDTETSVVQDLGAPSGQIVMGNRKRLSYPQGAITVVDGHVTTIDAAMTAWLERRRRGENPPISEPVRASRPTSMPPPPSAGPGAKTPRRAERGAPTGHIASFQFSARMYVDPADYFAGDNRRAWAEFMAKDRDEPGDPMAAVTYAANAQTADMFVPSSYDGSRPYALYVDLRSTDTGGMPAGYEAVCEQHRMIWVSPNGAGNDVHTARRCALALDAVASVKQVYRVDLHRVYAGGFSGGGAVAARLALLYPEVFRGLVVSARPVYLLLVRTPERWIYPSHFPFLQPEQLRQIAAGGVRAAFVSGPRDVNYPHLQRCITQWTDLGFAVRGFDVPDLGHSDAPAPIFAQAVDWVEGKP